MRPPSPDGQAAIEMLLALPLILLLSAGLFQIGSLWINSIRFDDACGSAARRYASGEVDERALPDAIWTALGPSQLYFVEGSIRLEPTDKSSSTGDTPKDTYRPNMDEVGVFKKYLRNPLFNYSKGDWCVTATYHSKPLLGLVFSNGITLRTEVCVFRYLGGGH